MTFAAVGSIIDVSTTTFSLTPGGTGDLILLELVNRDNSTVTVTGVSSSNATWSQMGTGFAGTTNAMTSSVWAGKVTSTSTQTVTISWSGTTPTIRAAGQEFSSTAGSWALDVQGHLDSGGTNTWPSLTPASGGELYFGYAYNTIGAANGSTSGYVYQSESHGDGLAYKLNCAGGVATGPVWGDSGQVFGIMLLVKETGTAAPPPDLPAIAPGSTWLDLFKPQWPRPRPPVPPPSPPGVSATGSFSLAPLALSGTGAQTSPDLPLAQPGPFWLRLFRPRLYKPVPPVPAVQPVNATGTFSLAPLAVSGQGAQTSPDLPQVQPGPWWIRLFRPDLFKPVPPPPATQGVNATGSLSLAPLAFSGTGAQTSPDQPQALPGPLWLRFFKPWVQRPVPPVPATSAVSVSGSLSLAPLALSGTGAQGSPDIPQVQPGPYWLRLFKPGLWKPVPPPPGTPSVNAAGTFALAPLGLSGTGAQTAPDLPAVQPGASWLRFFKPQWPKPRPLPLVPPPSGVQATGSLALAPLALSGQGAQTSPDLPAIAPGSTWLDLFKPWLVKPRPVPPAPGPVTASGSLALAPLALSGQASQTSPDVTQVQPGPLWLRLFRPWQSRPVPPVPATQAVSAAGSLSLAPLSLAAQGAQSSPDVPVAQPGPFWLRLFRPWIQRPVPPVPATPAVSAAGSLALAPLALSGTGSVAGAGVRDLPQIAPGPAWLRLYKPWVPRPLPANAGQGSAAHPFTGPPAEFTYGEPYFEWAYGSPYFEWETGDPHFEWTTGDPRLS